MTTEYKIVVTTPGGSFLQHAFAPAIRIANENKSDDAVLDVYIEFDDNGTYYQIPVEFHDTPNLLSERYQKLRWPNG